MAYNGAMQILRNVLFGLLCCLPLLVADVRNQAYVPVNIYTFNELWVVDTQEDKVISNISIPGQALNFEQLALSPDRTRGYLLEAGNGKDKIHVIDLETRSYITQIPLEGWSNPIDLQVTPDGKKLYLVSSGNGGLIRMGGRVEVIDVASNRIVKTVSPKQSDDTYNLRRIAITPDGSKVYVVESSNDQNKQCWIYVIDTASDEVTATIGLKGGASSIAMTPDGAELYAVNKESRSVSVVDVRTDRLIAKIGVGVSPGHVAVSPDGALAYVSNELSHNVSVIDTVGHRVIATIPVLARPIKASVHPDGTRVYVASHEGGLGGVSVISTQTHEVVAQCIVGSKIVDLALTPDGTKVYVVHGYYLGWPYHAVEVISTATDTSTAGLRILFPERIYT